MTRIILVLVAIIAVGLDQWIKHLVETGMEMHQQIDILPFLALYRVHNTGIAFSMLSASGDAVLIVLALAVVGFVVWLAARTRPEQLAARLGFALIIAGAVGNLIDRVFLGYVVDYVLFHVGSWSFAVFNLADAFITVGAGLVLLQEFIEWRRERTAGEGRGGDGA